MSEFSLGIGVMSGTSLDGLDLCLVRFSSNKDLQKFNILHAVTFEYDDFWTKTLKNFPSFSPEEFIYTHNLFGKFIGEKVNSFILEKRISKVDFIASHGHTIFHQPGKGFTFQAGNGAAISAECGIRVISDFRSVDVALGGQGAPLVPIGDKFLFGEYTFCLNLGGFANISFDNAEGKRIAYDICPVNFVLNYFSQKLGLPYDKDGLEGRKGKINENLLNKLNTLEFYKTPPPRSLGREWVEEIFFKKVPDIPPQDILATCYEHIAFQIASEINKNLIGEMPTVFTTGGGAFNSFLIEKIVSKTIAKIIVPLADIINYKEAVIFAFLGYLRLHGKINTLKSVTGAAKDSAGGALYKPF